MLICFVCILVCYHQRGRPLFFAQICALEELTWLDRELYDYGMLDCITTATHMLLLLISVTSVEELLLMVSVRAKSSLTVISLDRFCS